MRPLIRQSQINQAVEILKKGELVVMPTETVYGLAGDARNEMAIKKIFSVKGRPENHPLIVHIANIETLNEWAQSIPDYALVLAHHFWPGPMTLILKKQKQVLDQVTGGQDSVGIRIPAHPVAQQLLQAFQGGLAAPSANRFGYLSPTKADHVKQDLGNKVNLILDGGQCGIGIESTIIDCTGNKPQILRPGIISENQILEALNLDPMSLNSDSSSSKQVSGSLPSHYAPSTQTKLYSAEEIDSALDRQNIVILSSRKPSQRYVQLYDSRIPHRKAKANPDLIHWILMPSNANAYAHTLYEQLHFADQLHCKEIWIEKVPNSPEWKGILDRITKASFLIKK